MYAPIQPSRSEFLTVNDCRYHVRRWGRPGAPRLFLLHGWMDHSSTFQFMVDAFTQEWDIVAPDWRGFGRSGWSAGSYYAPDYLADLDVLLDHYAGHQPVRLVGHSMGGMVACLYAGIRPERVDRLVTVDGFGLAATDPADAPARYAKWLAQRKSPPEYGRTGMLVEMAAKLCKRQPHLTPARALWLAAELTDTEADGTLRYRADVKHKMVNPVLYRLEEAKACWRNITCPVHWVIGGDSNGTSMAAGVFATLDERRACFSMLTETTIARAGHMVQQDQPEALARTLEAFLADSR